MNPWREDWRADTFDMALQSQSLDDGRVMYRTVVSAGRWGAAVIAENTAGEVLLVRQYRVAVERDLWEFPRGAGDAEDADGLVTALRELQEETGYRGSGAKLLGSIYPDSAIIANGLHVVWCAVSDDIPGQCDGEIDALRWVSRDDLRRLICEGTIRDGISLAAFALWEAEGA